MRLRVGVVSLVFLGAVVAACGDDGESSRVDAGATTAPSTSVLPADPNRLYETEVTVLESPEHGPQLCLGGTQDSYPPQCGGPDVIGWSWDAVPWRESADGTTWATVHAIGTYDGTSFTLAEPPTEPTGLGGVWDMPLDFRAPCPEPEGGWVVRDPAKITMADQQAVMEYANTQPDIAAVWVDQSINPAYPGPGPFDEDVARRLNDPAQMILVFGFTGDLDRHREELESRWGGMLCVTQMEHTRAELHDLQMRASGDPDVGFLGASTDEVRNRVVLYVVVADEPVVSLVRERYGDLVDVRGALQPVN